jgi:periplasmic mercuric ion binding protein
MKNLIIKLVAIVVVFLSITIFGINSYTSSEKITKTQEVTLTIDGMTCSMCPLTIKTALKKLDGVTNVDVSYSDKVAKVAYEDDKITIEDIVKTIENAGNYKATPIDINIEGT